MRSNDDEVHVKPGRRPSRRELMAGAAGLLGAAAASSLAQAKPVSANSGDNLVAGRDNKAEGQTSILNDSQVPNHFTMLYAGVSQNVAGIYGDSAGYPGEGVHGRGWNGVGGEGIGYAGVSATGPSVGVRADSPTGEGVFGQHGSASSGPSTKSGVHGVTDSATDSAVLAENLGGGIGVSGSSSGAQDAVVGSSSSGNGVHGVSHDLNGVGAGVLGEQKGDAGTGVIGVGSVGVQGNSNAAGHSGVIGYGTYGVTAIPLSGGTGIIAISAFDGTGLALEAAGPAKFDDKMLASRAGVVSITYPKRTASVSVPGGLASASLVLATLQNVVAGVYVVSAVPNTTTGKVMINLNKAPGSASSPGTAVAAWFVVN